MYLSQLRFNLRNRRARFDLGDRYELHRTLLNAFPEQLLSNERILFRVENIQHQACNLILLQSQGQPNWEDVEKVNDGNYLFEPPRVRRVLPSFSEGVRLPFRLQANPTVKRNGKRHAIYADNQLMTWFERKAKNHGFSIEPLNFRHVKLGNKHGKKGRQTWHVVQFDGVLMVSEPSVFLETLINGIGSGKAFGFGLLSVPYS